MLPELKGRIDGISMRVPTADVSIVDLTAEVEKPATVDALNAAFRAARLPARCPVTWLFQKSHW